jgi:tetratricopeptide (TPR) repeat protein
LDKGDYDGALEQYEKALAIAESVLGTDHPATTYNNIGVGGLLFDEGDYDGAVTSTRSRNSRIGNSSSASPLISAVRCYSRDSRASRFTFLFRQEQFLCLDSIKYV